MLHLIFLANVRAKSDVWFIGDHLFRQAYPYLQELQNDHQAGQVNYLHENYDTYIFYPNFAENNVLTMVRNGFVEALNKRLKLPSAVIILTSDQLIVEDPLYLPSEIDRKLKWILREIDSAIKIRKSLLPLKAYTLGELRIMWVRAFQNSKANSVPKDTMLKFNNMLRRICMAKAVYTIPPTSYEESSQRCFDYNGTTQMKDGFKKLWHDVIQGIKQHNHNNKQAEIALVIKENTRNHFKWQSGSDAYINEPRRSNSSSRKARSSRSEHYRRDHWYNDKAARHPSQSPARHCQDY